MGPEWADVRGRVEEQGERLVSVRQDGPQLPVRPYTSWLYIRRRRLALPPRERLPAL